MLRCRRCEINDKLTIQELILFLLCDSTRLATDRTREQELRAVRDERDKEKRKVGFFAMDWPGGGVVTSWTVHYSGVAQVLGFSVGKAEYEEHAELYATRRYHDLFRELSVTVMRRETRSNRLGLSLIPLLREKSEYIKSPLRPLQSGPPFISAASDRHPSGPCHG